MRFFVYAERKVIFLQRLTHDILCYTFAKVRKLELLIQIYSLLQQHGCGMDVLQSLDAAMTLVQLSQNNHPK